MFSLPRSQQVGPTLVCLLGLGRGFPSQSPFLPGGKIGVLYVKDGREQLWDREIRACHPSSSSPVSPDKGQGFKPPEKGPREQRLPTHPLNLSCSLGECYS